MCAHATPDGEEHPENPERLRAIWRKLNAAGVASRCVALKAKEAEDKYIDSVHSKSHIKLMKEISSKKYNASRNKIARKFNSIYFNKGSSESAVLAAGSVIEVAEKVAAGELSSAIALVRPPGHHAEHDEAMGFCLLNNVAVAANYLLNEKHDLGIKKILIVDWDVHHGNSTQKMFYNDPRVLFFSVHRFDHGSFYPAEGDASHCFIGEEAGKGYNINVPWEHGKCGDADYIAAWDHVLLPVTKVFDPDIILVSAGFDAALGDPLGGCCITPNGYALLLTKLLGFAQGRIVMALEGGYNLRSIANSVCACAKVLLGDKFTFNAPEMQPFESTWRVIQAVRNELKTYWPVLSSKLPKNVSLRMRPSPSELNASSGSESDSEDVAELFATVEVVVDATSEQLSKMELDDDNLSVKTASSCSAAEQHLVDSVKVQNNASATTGEEQPAQGARATSPSTVGVPAAVAAPVVPPEVTPTPEEPPASLAVASAAEPSQAGRATGVLSALGAGDAEQRDASAASLAHVTTGTGSVATALPLAGSVPLIGVPGAGASEHHVAWHRATGLPRLEWTVPEPAPFVLDDAAEKARWTASSAAVQNAFETVRATMASLDREAAEFGSNDMYEALKLADKFLEGLGVLLPERLSEQLDRGGKGRELVYI